MIFGLSHLTINTSDIYATESLLKKNKYKKVLFFNAVQNHPSKKKFISSWSEDHKLMLLSSENKPSIELTEYQQKSILKNNQIKINKSVITLKISNIDLFLKIFTNALGFHRAENNLIFLKGLMKKWDCKIKFEPGKSNPSFLDSIGPSCLAFFSSNLEDDSNKLISFGAQYCTRKFNIFLGDKKIDIILIRLPEGIIIELLNIKKCPKKLLI